MLAYDYPLLGLFWTAFIVFIWIAWLMLVFRVIFDVFRSDMSGIAKAVWALAIVIVPFLGVLIYLIANGDDMAQRDIATAQANEAAMQDYIRSAAGPSSTADELSKLAQLHQSGVLTDDEFAAQKAKLIG